MHDVRQLSGQVPVAGLHLIVVLVLVFFYQSFVDAQSVTTRVYKLPTEGCIRLLHCLFLHRLVSSLLHAVGIRT